MYDAFKIVRMLRNAKAAALSLEFNAILASAEEIATFLGYAPEAAEVVAIVRAIEARDIVATLQNFDDLAILLLKHFATGGALTMGTAPDFDEIESICRSLETPLTLRKPMAANPIGPTMDPGTIALLIRVAIALIQLIRERRKNR